MSESVEYPLVPLADAINLWQQDLWRFNGGIPPKFWFGDRVKCSERSATIVGMQWRSEERSFIPLFQGWIYLVIFTPGGRISLFHETSVKAIETGEEQCNLTNN
ncbi:hypothetical protein [Phormidium nigroviride]